MSQVWGHRGASADAAENTLAAFEAAADQGADGIELDVQRTRDGVLVVCHDETVDRTSDGTGRLVDLDHADLRRLDFGSWHSGVPAHLPTLAEVLALAADRSLRVNIELKNNKEPYPGLAEQVHAAVLASPVGADAAEQVVYSSFNFRGLVPLLWTPVPVGLLYTQAVVRPWVFAAAAGVNVVHPMAVHPRADTIVPVEVAQAHLAGVAVHAWTVDEPDRVRALARAGVDAVITNRPAVAVAALASSPDHPAGP